jgi:hypothetical protein
MNLHATVPLDQAPAVAGDEVARVLNAAKISDGPQLLDALEARRNELGLSNRTCELAAGLTEGHWTKCCGPAREKSPTLATLDRIMEVLGLSFVLVRDPTKIDRVQPQWRRRHEEKVRVRALSPIVLRRARPILMRELARRASRPRWASVPAREFMRAMAGDET